MRFFPLPLALTVLVGTVFFGSAAHADAPPPPNVKFVNYSFTVHGLSTTDQVLFAYPCSDSNGAPIDALKVVRDGEAVTVGRRGGECALYTIAKASYDKFNATYEPAYRNEDPALKAFAKTATACAGKPTPSFSLPKSDARITIEEVLDVSLSNGACNVTSRNASELTSTDAKDPTNGPSGPKGPTSSTPTSSAPASAAADDGGCSVGGSARGVFPWLIALVVPVLLRSTRRKARAS
jgi:hypothetical protein